MGYGLRLGGLKILLEHFADRYMFQEFVNNVFIDNLLAFIFIEILVRSFFQFVV